jgi:hypothetical protein
VQFEKREPGGCEKMYKPKRWEAIKQAALYTKKADRKLVPRGGFEPPTRGSVGDGAGHCEILHPAARDDRELIAGMGIMHRRAQ